MDLHTRYISCVYFSTYVYIDKYGCIDVYIESIIDALVSCLQPVSVIDLHTHAMSPVFISQYFFSMFVCMYVWITETL